MFTDPTLLVINLLGIVFGVVFIVLNIGVGRLLTDPTLKTYFRWITFAVIVFVVSFVADFFEAFLAPSIAENIHHLLMILFLFIFVMASVNLTQDIKQNNKHETSVI